MQRGFSVVILCVLLGACGRSDGLPPEEVLKRTARASQELSSARFFLVATPRWEYGSEGGELTFNIDGRLQNGGQQVQFLTSMQGDIWGMNKEALSLTSVFEVIVSGPQEQYLNVHALDSQPSYAPFESPTLTNVIGKWLALSSPVSPSSVSSIAPDPKLLKMQSEVVDILRDRGRGKILGRSVYHYEVGLNTEKLLAFFRELSRVRQEPIDTTMLETLLTFVNANGELFIDTETFLIDRLVWHINAPKVPFGKFALDLTLDLKDHGKASPILPPPETISFPSTVSLPVDINDLSSGNFLQEMTSPLEEELQSEMIDNGS